MNNYLDYETTKLLPNINPYCNESIWCKSEERVCVKEGNGFEVFINKQFGVDTVEIKPEYKTIVEYIVWNKKYLNLIVNLSKGGKSSFTITDRDAWTYGNIISYLIQNKIYPRILDFTDVYGNVCWWFEIRGLKDYEQTLAVSEVLGYEINFETYDECLEAAIKECLIILKNEKEN